MKTSRRSATVDCDRCPWIARPRNCRHAVNLNTRRRAEFGVWQENNVKISKTVPRGGQLLASSQRGLANIGYLRLTPVSSALPSRPESDAIRHAHSLARSLPWDWSYCLSFSGVTHNHWDSH